MSERVHVDANVILRFLRKDDPEQSPIGADLFQRAQAGSPILLVSAVTLLEVFYVLSTSYGILRVDAAKILVGFLNTGAVACEDGGVTSDALKRITANKVSFGDAYLAACARHGDEAVASFDEGMRNFSDVRAFPLKKAKPRRGSE